MSGELYFHCKNCFSQWFVDWEDNDHPQICLNCGCNDISVGDLGSEGDFANLILDIIKDSEEIYHENHIILLEFTRKVFQEYFKESESDFEGYDEDRHGLHCEDN
jgi:hypothetical protein